MEGSFSRQKRLSLASWLCCGGLLVSLLSLCYSYVICDSENWRLAFAGAVSAKWRGVCIEFGRHAILMPLVLFLIAFRFGVQVRHFFSARSGVRIWLYRFLLAMLTFGVLGHEIYYHFGSGGLTAFQAYVGNNSETSTIQSIYRGYFFYSIVQYLFIAIPLAFWPLYALHIDIPFIIRANRKIHGLISRNETNWDEFRKEFREYKSELLTRSLRYIEVLAIVAISVCYELLIGFTTLTPGARTMAFYWWSLIAFSAIMPITAWAFFGETYSLVLRKRADQTDAEWNQGNNCQSFVLSLFTASPGGVIALLLFVTLLQQGLQAVDFTSEAAKKNNAAAVVATEQKETEAKPTVQE